MYDEFVKKVLLFNVNEYVWGLTPKLKVESGSHTAASNGMEHGPI